MIVHYHHIQYHQTYINHHSPFLSYGYIHLQDKVLYNQIKQKFYFHVYVSIVRIEGNKILTTSINSFKRIIGTQSSTFVGLCMEFDLSSEQLPINIVHILIKAQQLQTLIKQLNNLQQLSSIT